MPRTRCCYAQQMSSQQTTNCQSRLGPRSLSATRKTSSSSFCSSSAATRWCPAMQTRCAYNVNQASHPSRVHEDSIQTARNDRSAAPITAMLSAAKCRREATDNRIRAYPCRAAACDGAIDISAAALPSPGGYGFLAEYPVKPHLGSPVSVCAAGNGCGAVSAAADALAGRGDDTPPLQDTSR